MTPTFGKNLREYRTALQMTQDDLAALAGVDKQTVSNWETERTTPWPAKAAEVWRKLLVFKLDLPQPPAKSRIIDRI